MAAQLEELQVKFRDEVTRGAQVAADALTRMGAAGDKAKESVEQTDEVVRRAGQSAEQLARRYIEAERATAAKEAAERKHARALEDVARQEQAGSITAQRAADLRQNIARQAELDAARISAAAERRAAAEARLLAGNAPVGGGVPVTGAPSGAAAGSAAAAVNSLAAANDNAARSGGRLGAAMGQAGFQVQDFATQVSMGQNALTAFGVQFAQFAGIFGTGGAIAGAVVTVGLIATQLIATRDAQKAMNDALKSADDLYRSSTEAAQAYRNSLDEEANRLIALRGYYSSLNAERRAFEVARLEDARRPLEDARVAVGREAVTAITQPGVGPGAVAQRQLVDLRSETARRRQPYQPSGQQIELASIGYEIRALQEAGQITADTLIVLQERLRSAGQAGGELGEAARDTAQALTPTIERLQQAEAALNRNRLAAAAAAGTELPALQTGLNGSVTALNAASTAAERLANRMQDIRRIAAANPALAVQQEAAAIQAQLDAARRGGLDGLNAETRAQENNRRVNDSMNRAYEEQLRRLQDLGVPRDRAEEQARSAAAEAGQETMRRNELADALERERDRLQSVARGARDAADAYGALRTNSAGLLSLGTADDRAVTEAQRALRGSAIDPAQARRGLTQAEDAQRRFEQQSVESFARIGENALDRIGSSLVDSFARGEGAALDFGNVARAVLVSAAADLAKLGAINPLSNAAFGLSRPTLAGAFAGGPVQGPNPDGSVTTAGGGGGIFSMIGLPGGLGTELGFSPLLYGGPATLGGALGGIGGGFALGSLTSQLTARSAAQRTNGQIGAGLGATAGFLIGGPIGGLVGGAAGGALGGMLGPSSSFSGGDAVIGVGADGLLSLDRTVGKRFDTAALSANANQQIAAVNEQLRALGLSFRDGIGDTRIGGGGSAFATNLADSLRNSGALGALRASDSRIQGAIDRSGAADLNGILSVAQQAQQFVGVLEGLKPASDDPVEQIRKQFEGLFESARTLGFGLDEVTAAQDRAIKAQQDARDAAAKAEQDARRDQARANVAGVVTDLADYARSLRVANDNSGTPLTRLAAARAQYEGDAQRSLGGDLGSLQRVRGSAETLRQLTREVYGTGQPLASVESDITRLLEQIGQVSEEQLTASAMQAIAQTQTQQLGAVMERLRNEVAQLRADVRQASANPLAARAA